MLVILMTYMFIRSVLKFNRMNSEIKELREDISREQRLKKIILKRKVLNESKDFFGQNCEDYRRNCFNLFDKLRFPNENLVFRPALKEIPTYLLDQFTQNGDLPLSSNWYFNEVFNDADSNRRSKSAPVDIKLFDLYRHKVRKWEP